MVLGRVTPAAGVVWERIVWWTKVCGSNHNGLLKTPFWVTYTFDFKASATTQSIVE